MSVPIITDETSKDEIELLTPTCATFANGDLALVRSEDGRWVILDKSAKVVWASA